MTEPIPDLARDLGQSPYELDRPVAQGGMGEVWEVSHRALGTRYVMKVLRADLGRRRDLEKRLKIEARASVQLEQENVVRVHDFGWTESGRPYLVMEKLEGETLHKEYEGKVLPPAEVVAIAKDTLAGLAAAHAAGFVHRDIKPDNLFYCAPDEKRNNGQVARVVAARFNFDEPRHEAPSEPNRARDAPERRALCRRGHPGLGCRATEHLPRLACGNEHPPARTPRALAQLPRTVRCCTSPSWKVNTPARRGAAGQEAVRRRSRTRPRRSRHRHRTGPPPGRCASCNCGRAPKTR